ncbi:lipase family alpha/beta hydrolase [Nocardia terpenica]|uniref:Lipase n=1 Tax=Nocardia terpenica TaxID=455432 RepID=A0A291RPH5_9NOCA|nr:lipase [Nocardia terpenica]ATL69247.1 lipase [Nocardia terpenica]
MPRPPSARIRSRRARGRSRPPRWISLIALIATLPAAAALDPETAAAAPVVPYHVPWRPGENLAAFLPHLGDFRGTPPGANDWNCKPSPAHPDPVILLSGASVGPAQNYVFIAPLLANNGYCVFTLTYGIDPTTVTPLPGNRDMRQVAAEELAPFVDRVLDATGAEKVDFLGHSEGTVMPRWYIKFLGGAQKVAKSVNLASLWNGSSLLGLNHLLEDARRNGSKAAIEAKAGTFTHSMLDFITGSDYLNAVNEGQAFPLSVEYTSIVTRYDEGVVPYTSGIAPPGPNITNIVLQDVCPADLSEHNFLAADPVVGQIILNALDPANAQPINCNGIPRNSG